MHMEPASLVSEKEKIKCKNIKKNDTKMFNSDDVTKKTLKNIIQTGHKFLIIHTEY